MLDACALDLLKHILHQENWVHTRLQHYEGKTAHIRIPPLFDLKLQVLEDGDLSHFQDQIETDTTLVIPPALLPGLLMCDEPTYKQIDISGNTAFAEDLITIGKHIKPHFENELSKILGDIPAHRIAQTSNSLFQWHTNLFWNLSDSLAEYWLEEQPIITKSDAINNAATHIKKLQNDVDQLEDRINRILKSKRPDAAF